MISALKRADRASDWPWDFARDGWGPVPSRINAIPDRFRQLFAKGTFENSKGTFENSKGTLFAYSLPPQFLDFRLELITDFIDVLSRVDLGTWSCMIRESTLFKGQVGK